MPGAFDQAMKVALLVIVLVLGVVALPEAVAPGVVGEEDVYDLLPSGGATHEPPEPWVCVERPPLKC